MLSLPTAILIAGIAIGIGTACGLSAVGYFLFRIVTTLSIFKVSANANEAAFLHRQFEKSPPAPKVVPEMPDFEIATLAEDPEILKNLREHQTAPLPEIY